MTSEDFLAADEPGDEGTANGQDEDEHLAADAGLELDDRDEDAAEPGISPSEHLGLTPPD